MLLDEIIALLSEQNSSLEAALLKTKALLHQIGHKELVPWVTHELAGYPEGVEIPPYRIVTSQPHAQLMSIAWQHPDFVLPVLHLPQKYQDTVSKTGITSSIGTIQQDVGRYRKEGKGLIRHLPLELAGEFQKALEKGVNIVSLWCTINMADLEAIVIQVRSRLLDFCLELQEVVGVAVDPKELHAKAAMFDAAQVFQTTINNPGTVIVGAQNVQVNNKMGDVDGLIAQIAKLGYEDHDLSELRHAVNEDRASGQIPDVAKGKTGEWFKTAMSKAGKGIVKVGVDVAAAVITKSLEHYAKGG
jgi:hypothetical protein